MRVRAAALADLDAMMVLEKASFATDQLSRRAMRHAILSPAQMVLVAVQDQALAAACIIGFRAGSDKARLSSIAVVPDFTGRGVGRELLIAAEHHARQRGACAMRLEVRADNAAAIRMYERSGYAMFDRITDYYEDGSAALRLEKKLG
ncbi:MAG: GNAT family N-acetyltransferase [Beijerinckiaceae bacterium]